MTSRRAPIVDRPPDRSSGWLAAIVVLAAVFRFWDLGGHSLWFDESATVHFSKPAPWDLWGEDTHPPLYYLAMHFWMLLGDGEWWLRFFSVLFSLGTVVAVYFAGRSLGGVRVGLLAAAWVAVSSFEVRYAHEARMYALLSFGVALALAGLIPLLRDPAGAALRPRVQAWGLYIAGTVIAVYAHNMGALWPLAASAAALVVFAGQPAWGAIARNWIRANGIVLLIWAIYWPWLFMQAAGVLSGFHFDQPSANRVLSDVGWIHFGQFMTATPWQIAGTALGSVAVLVGLISLGARLGVALLLLALLPLLFTLLAGLLQPLYVNRVLIWAGLPSALLAAAGVDWLWRRSAQLRPVAVVLLVAVLALRGNGMIDRLANIEKSDWRGTMTLLAAQLRPGDVVALWPGHERLSWDYYAGRIAMPPVEVLSIYPDKLARAMERLDGLQPRSVTAVVSLLFPDARPDDLQELLRRSLGCAERLEELKLKGIVIQRYATGESCEAASRAGALADLADAGTAGAGPTEDGGRSAC